MTLNNTIQINLNKSICIIDWCGGRKSGGFWCDYFPDKGIVIFGGEWEDVPDLIIDHEPTPKECENYAKEHTSFKYS